MVWLWMKLFWPTFLIIWLRSFVFLFIFGPIDLRGCLTISLETWKGWRRSRLLGVGGSTGPGRDRGGAAEEIMVLLRHLSDHLQPIYFAVKKRADPNWSCLIVWLSNGILGRRERINLSFNQVILYGFLFSYVDFAYQTKSKNLVLLIFPWWARHGSFADLRELICDVTQ